MSEALVEGRSLSFAYTRVRLDEGAPIGAAA